MAKRAETRVGFPIIFSRLRWLIEPTFSQVCYFIYTLWYTKCGSLDNTAYQKCPMALRPLFGYLGPARQGSFALHFVQLLKFRIWTALYGICRQVFCTWLVCSYNQCYSNWSVLCIVGWLCLSQWLAILESTWYKTKSNITTFVIKSGPSSSLKIFPTF